MQQLEQQIGDDETLFFEDALHDTLTLEEFIKPRICLEENNSCFILRRSFFLIFTNSYFILFSFIFYVIMVAQYLVLLAISLVFPERNSFFFVYTIYFLDGLAFYFQILKVQKDWSKMEKTTSLLKKFDFVFAVIFIGITSVFVTSCTLSILRICERLEFSYITFFYRALMPFCFFYPLMNLYLFYHQIIWITNTQLSRASVKQFNKKNYLYCVTNLSSIIVQALDSIFNLGNNLSLLSLLITLGHAYYFLLPCYALNNEIKKKTKLVVNDLFTSPFLCLLDFPVDTGTIVSVSLLFVTVFCSAIRASTPEPSWT